MEKSVVQSGGEIMRYGFISTTYRWVIIFKLILQNEKQVEL